MNKLELAEQIYLDQIAGPEVGDSMLSVKAEYAISAAEIFYTEYVRLREKGVARQKLVGCKACFGSGGKKTAPCKVCLGAGKVLQPD